MDTLFIKKVENGFVMESGQANIMTPEEVLAIVKRLLGIQADELEPAKKAATPKDTPKDTPKLARTFQVGDRVRVTSLDFSGRCGAPDSILGQCGRVKCGGARNRVDFAEDFWWFPPEALELADEKPEKRFCVFHEAGVGHETIEIARGRAEEHAQNHPGDSFVVCETVATCTAVEKKTVEVKWS